jgi:hypothetical protein
MARPGRLQKEAVLQEINRRRDQPDVQAMLDLLGLMLEECKSQLVTCEPEVFAALQGEAQAYDRLIRQITRPASSSKG